MNNHKPMEKYAWKWGNYFYQSMKLNNPYNQHYKLWKYLKNVATHLRKSKQSSSFVEVIKLNKIGTPI